MSLVFPASYALHILKIRMVCRLNAYHGEQQQSDQI